MSEILSLFSVFTQHLSATPLRQLQGIVFGMLAMTGSITMLNISRWTPKGGSYRTLQRFFNTILPWGTLCSVFFREHLLDPEAEYILAADEVTAPKAGDHTHGLGRFFSSVYGKVVPGVSFFAVSFVNTQQRRAYPMRIEQIVREAAPRATEMPNASEATSPRDTGAALKRTPGRPKGSRNRKANQGPLTDTLKHLQDMIQKVLEDFGEPRLVKYAVLDGYFGHSPALEMVKQTRLSLISKLRSNAALYFPPTEPSSGPGRPRIYGERLNPRQIETQYRVCSETTGNITTDIYQMQLRSRRFTDLLNVVCLLKTHNTTQRKAHVFLFSNDLTLEAEKMIDHYALRFQIEFNFRDAKQFWGLADFMNVKQTPVETAANLSMFMVNVAEKLRQPFRSVDPDFSVLDLKARYRGRKYLQETLKILPQKPDPIFITHITEHLSSIGAIHHIPHQSNTG